MKETSYRDELIAKLMRISRLYKTTIEIQNEMNSFKPEDHYERHVVVPAFPSQNGIERKKLKGAINHKDKNAVEKMRNAHEHFYGPRKPVKPRIEEFQKPKDQIDELKKKIGCLPVGAAFVGAISLLVILFSGSTDDGTILWNWIILAVCSAIIACAYIKIAREKAKHEEVCERLLREYTIKKTETLRQYSDELIAYETAYATYKLGLQEYLEEYIKWRKAYLESLKEEELIAEKLEVDRVAAVEKINKEKMLPAQNILNEVNDLLTDEYLPVVDTIINLLKNGRANDLKEAINLYEDIVYREKQLQLEREKEKQRQYEAEQKRKDAERHLQEQMKFQQQQEWQRRREAEQKRKDAERHHREEMQLQEKRLKQEADLAKASRQKRCILCAHRLTCREQYYEGAYNCPGFTPKQ